MGTGVTTIVHAMQMNGKFDFSMSKGTSIYAIFAGNEHQWQWSWYSNWF